MTGPEHYQKAERLLAKAEQSQTAAGERLSLTTAQVHATLAVADFFRAWTEAQS